MWAVGARPAYHNHVDAARRVSWTARPSRRERRCLERGCTLYDVGDEYRGAFVKGRLEGSARCAWPLAATRLPAVFARSKSTASGYEVSGVWENDRFAKYDGGGVQYRCRACSATFKFSTGAFFLSRGEENFHAKKSDQIAEMQTAEPHVRHQKPCKFRRSTPASWSCASSSSDARNRVLNAVFRVYDRAARDRAGPSCARAREQRPRREGGRRARKRTAWTLTTTGERVHRCSSARSSGKTHDYVGAAETAGLLSAASPRDRIEIFLFRG